MLTISLGLSRSSVAVSETQAVAEVSPSVAKQPQANESKQSPYQADQQVKFLHLEAEVDFLLQQMQSLKQQRMAINRDDAGKA